MNQRPPKLTKHATGQYKVRWGGKDHYLGHDHEKAQRAYLDHLARWADWRQHRNTQRLPPIRSTTTVIEIAEQFLRSKAHAAGNDAARYYRKHLRRFLNLYGVARVETIRPKHIQALKDDMLMGGLAPRTVNHDITAIRGMMRYAQMLELAPAVSFERVRKLPLGLVPDKSISVADVLAMIGRATCELRPWLVLNYLCAMRPSEVVRIAHERGQWVGDGVYRIPGKSDKRSPVPRCVVFSEFALTWLPAIRPHWSRLDTYSAACRHSTGCGPGLLRHSAATHLVQAGASREATDLILGHSPGRVSATYARIEYQPLRVLVGRLGL